MNTSTSTELGRSVKAWREYLGMSQSALAERSGISRQTINEIEAGTRSPNTRTLLALSNALGHTSWDGLATAPDVAESLHKANARAGLPPDTPPEVSGAQPYLPRGGVEILPVFTGVPGGMRWVPDAETWIGTLPAPSSIVRHPNRTVWLVQADESMSPEIPQGAYMLIDLGVRNPYPGEAVFLQHEGVFVIRAWARGASRKVMLKPANRSYGPGTPADRTTKVVGVVLAVVIPNSRRAR
ncbi:MAG: helix-turn-helix domain-containing protein [Acidobacteria bacterium]|nr:helix-turn-helix domain-containing protein [Acidobacteriota bacterium]